MQLSLNESSIIWPGRQKTKPEGFMIPTFLKILTIEEKPFVYVRAVTEPKAVCHTDEIPCPLFNATEEDYQTFCCRGYCVDLLKHLAETVNFTYSLALSPDGQFGNYIIKNSSGNY